MPCCLPPTLSATLSAAGRPSREDGYLYSLRFPSAERRWNSPRNCLRPFWVRGSAPTATQTYPLNAQVTSGAASLPVWGEGQAPQLVQKLPSPPQRLVLLEQIGHGVRGRTGAPSVSAS